MTRLISVSNDVYNMLSKLKGKNMSFSEIIKSLIKEKNEKGDIRRFAGILKDEKEELDKFEKQITRDRRKNFGRKIE